MTMKKMILQLTALLAVITAGAQITPGQQPISAPPAGAPNSGAINPYPYNGSGVIATNQAGQTYSLNQLASQLANLRAAVDQTLPTLAAFNSEFSATPPGSTRSQELANAISGLLGGALSHNANQNSSIAGGHGLTNFAQVLNGIVTTNSTAPGSAALSPNTIAQLQSLQTDLNQVRTILQNLNLGFGPAGAPGQLPGVSSGTPPPSGNTLPTGR